ncbi:hypothetical protein EDB19DRAFT_1775441 [Suillus lakei]|nr:hypothetical protein EDB19DRAFT_1775441 [Suillus lakei]
MSMPKLTVRRNKPAASGAGIRAIRRVMVHPSILKASQLRSGDVVALSEADDGNTKKVRIISCMSASLSQFIRSFYRTLNYFKLSLIAGFCNRDTVAFSGRSTRWYVLYQMTRRSLAKFDLRLHHPTCSHFYFVLAFPYGTP